MNIMDKLRDFKEKFTVLKTAPRELWIVYLINITEYVAYTLMQYSIMLWLSKDLGQSDGQAAGIFMAWGMVLSAMMIFAGMITDSLGIKLSFLIGYAVCMVGRFVMAFDPELYSVIIAGLGPVAIGMALMSPVVAAAIRRYTSLDQRSMAFSMFYVLMNVGYAIGARAWDEIRAMVDGTIDVGGFAMTEFQFLFFISACITVAGTFIIQAFMRKNVEVDETSGVITVSSSSAGSHESPIKIFISVVREKQFWVFILFLAFLVGVKSVFYHMNSSLPLFAERFIGEKAKIGTAWGVVNPMVIVLFVPFIGALTQKISSFKMIVVGSFISALSVFILCIPPEVFQPVVDSFLGPWIASFLGETRALNPWYISLIIFTIIFTIGEGIWSPRLFEYTASIAPKGREGSYMSLSILPWFASKPLVGLLQAWILPAYAPEGGPYNPFMFWGIIGLTALSSPVLVVIFARFIRKYSDPDGKAGATTGA